MAYELAGQKIAAKRYASDHPDEQPIAPEHIEATPPHSPPAAETHNWSSSSLQRLTAPDDDPRTSESEDHSSFELRSMHERSMISLEATEAVISVPSPAVVANTSGLEESGKGHCLKSGARLLCRL